MRAAWLIVPSLLILGACGDPLADIERVTDDTFIPDTGVATALPTQAELEREDSVLSGLFRNREEPEVVVEQPAPLPVQRPTTLKTAAAFLGGIPPAKRAELPCLRLDLAQICPSAKWRGFAMWPNAIWAHGLRDQNHENQDMRSMTAHPTALNHGLST